MSATPWNSIAESVVPAQARELTLAQATESPCATCSTSPCCTHLPLTTFQVTNLTELDHAIYLLNFDRIELGLSASGEWSAYYTQPCRFLDRESFGCTIHDTPEQPRICVHYNPYRCWYKTALTTADSADFVRLDRGRLERLVQHIRFAEDRTILSVPAWEDIVEMMAAHDDTPAPAHVDPPLLDPMIETWLDGVDQAGVATSPARPDDPGADDTTQATSSPTDAHDVGGRDDTTPPTTWPMAPASSTTELASPTGTAPAAMHTTAAPTTEAAPTGQAETIEAHSADSLRNPCSDCDAYCCTTLVFPQAMPTHVSNFDYLQFCLGFPGIELLVADGSWSVVVRTTCRHLDDGDCGIFGQPERPLICRYYDAASCDYRPQFGTPRPTWSMRVRLEQYATLLAQLPFDADGNLLAMPAMEDLRTAIEVDAPTRRHLPILT